MVRGVTAVHQDRTDLDHRAAVVSKTKMEVEKKKTQCRRNAREC